MPICILVEPILNRVNGIDTLKEFGEVRYLFDGKEKRPSVFKTESFSDEMHSRIKHLAYNPLTDFIVIAGSLNTVTQLVALAINLSSDGCVKGLMFSPQCQAYVAVDLG